MTLHHYLRPLLSPQSVAVVGASERPGSLGRIIYENLLDGEFKGELHAVNPNHRRVLGRKSLARISSIGKPIDLALIAIPCAAVPGVIEDGARAGLKAAIVFSAPPIDEGDARRWLRDLAATAHRRRVRLLGPHAFGVIRTEIGLNATLGASAARPGRLALVAQSGAMCSAMLDFSMSVGLGFSTVVAIGGGIDVGFGELLDALLLDPSTDGILLYIETVRDARRFMSALRAAARTKPVIVLKAGRSAELCQPALHGLVPPLPDVVFDAAVRRSGTVRVMTYAQLFSAARILSMGRTARGGRLAIVTNGHGPGTLAADIAADRGVELARLAPATDRRLAAVLPPNVSRDNPVNVRGDALPERLAAAVEATLADEGVDAVLTLHVQRPMMAATDAARAVAEVARPSRKPVLGAWLGAIDRHEVDDALEAGGIANFYTPEHAVEAFSFLDAYRRNQRWLLEVAPPQPEPQPPDYAAAEKIRMAAANANRTVLTGLEARRLLVAFGLPVPPTERADTLKEALAAARALGYPVRLIFDAVVASSRAAPPLAERRALRNGRMLSRAYGQLFEGVKGTRRAYRGVLVQRDPILGETRDVAIAVHTDPVFGPVISFGNTGGVAVPDPHRAVMLPPLNRRLALDAVTASDAPAGLKDGSLPDAREPLVRLLLHLSSLVCAVPWLRSLVLDPVRVGATEATVAGIHAVVDPKRRFVPGDYRHMAIHPYPVELVSEATLRDGTSLHVRPIMPEDALLEQAFVAGLSEQTRYFRFFYRLHELTPGMLARFTQVDYDRELALVAVDTSTGAPQFVGVARYICNPDRESAEFAVVVADAWQARGVGYVLMNRLIERARNRGLARLEGAVLRANSKMLKFVQTLGFTLRDDSSEPEQVIAVRRLR